MKRFYCKTCDKGLSEHEIEVRYVPPKTRAPWAPFEGEAVPTCPQCWGEVEDRIRSLNEVADGRVSEIMVEMLRLRRELDEITGGKGEA